MSARKDSLAQIGQNEHIEAEEKNAQFIGSSQKDLSEFPEEARRVIGYAIYVAQCGEKHEDAKPLKGFGGGCVLEVVESHDGNAYRAVYTVKFEGIVYVLHAFQKKSKRGSETPKHDMDLIRSRLKLAEAAYKASKETK